MDTNSVTNPSAASPPPTPPTPSDNAADALSSDFETFLKVLTVQMENQDPLNPIESADFAVQLATFSGVEQQVRTNDLLESLVSDQALSGLTDIAGWVGQEARAPVSAHYSGSPVELFLDLPTAADQATLRLFDANGSVVSQIAIGADARTYSWDGTDASGAPVAPGQYSFTVESRDAGEFLSTIAPEVYAPVTEARLVDGAPVLVMEGGETIPVADVTGVRRGDVP